jgi:hypothetical protein
MYKQNEICVVVPAYNEERLIGRVLQTMPEYLDLAILLRKETNASDGIAKAYASLVTD